MSSLSLRQLTGNGLPITQTDVLYVDGSAGNDSSADGTIKKPFATIQACLNYLGQPITKSDYQRHITINLSDSLTSLPGSSPASWNGIYQENLVIPNRCITFVGAGVKVGNNTGSGYGNVLVEFSKSRCFGGSSSDFRPGITWMGRMNVRDSHNRLRNGMHIGGTYRISIMKRLFDSIQGDGVNKITVHIAAGQNPYPITIPTTYPTEPRIRIVVQGTTNYNATYDITAQIDATTFEATRVSGTNAAVSVETSGTFFESDSAGASGLTHDSAFTNTYVQGQYTSDDGTVNGAAPTSGTEVLYSNGSRFFTGIQGRGILLQRWKDTTLASAVSVIAGAFIIGQKYTITAIGSTDFTLIGAASNTVGLVFVATGVGTGTGTASTNVIVNSISGMDTVSVSGDLETATFTYGTDDMGWMNCRFNGATKFTVSSASQTVRMDSTTFGSFINGGGTWITNTPTIANVANFIPIVQNSKSANYTTVLGDANKHLLHPSADTSARTFTIDSNATVPYQIGTAITFVNQDSAGVLTIAITTDTMRLAGAGTTGSRTLAANGMATALKITATEWIISGTGLT